MNSDRRRLYVMVIGTLAICLLFVLRTQMVLGHRSGGYSHDSTRGGTNADWMATLPDCLRVSQLSIPGTHDTMSFYGGDAVQTQSMPLSDQLLSGIRAVDIRCRHYRDRFAIHHGPVYQHANFDDVLIGVISFLQQHPTETILMRLKPEHTAAENTRTFTETFEWYRFQHGLGNFWLPPWPWRGQDSYPTLGEVRGKIVIIQNFGGPRYGIAWGETLREDHYDFPTITYQYTKWEFVKQHLRDADTGDVKDIYINGLHGATGAFPYFVASGHSSPGTGAPRLATGLVDPWTCSAAAGCKPDFPRLSCVFGVCSVYYEGTNELTLTYINGGNIARRTGLVMADFPGPDLIRRVIGVNSRAACLPTPTPTDTLTPTPTDTLTPTPTDTVTPTDTRPPRLVYLPVIKKGLP